MKGMKWILAAAAVAAAGKNGRTDVSDVQNAAASKTAAAAEDMKKAAERSGFDRKKWESTGTPEKAEEKPKKGKKAFIIAGIAAVLVIIAVILALAKPWDNDDAPEGGVPNNEDTQPVDGEEDKTGDQDGENGEFNKPDDTQNAADDPDKDGDTPDAAEPGNDGGEDGPGTENGQTQGGDDDSQPGQEGGNPQSPGNSQTSQGGTSGGSGSGSNGSSGTNESSTGNSGSSAPKNNDVLFPSDSTLITESDLEGKTSYETYMLINEIYARHGKIFKTASIQKYFESQVWYTPVTSDSSAITPLFNDIETANVKTITAYQKAQGFRDGGTSSDTETQPGDSENNDDPAPAEPDTPEEPAKPVNNDVLFPSDTTLITAEDMEGMTRYETYMLINEIYARHGKIFKTESVQEYFESQIWYTPVSTSYSQAENQFNDIEWTNIYTIIEYQESQGYRD
ncbi:MAG: YARHG domain-containing protein [Oscillospiraceae bacterium]